jgi:hypothetical protein
MDEELWASIVSTIRGAAAAVGWNGGRRRPVYPNGLVAAMYAWCVWHDRPLCWACRRGSYGALFRRPRRLPSVSQFSRRVRSDDCQRILQLAHDAFAQRRRIARLALVDGKALPVSPVSRDRDARRGRVSGAFARGYKLHALVNEARRIVVWSVTGLNGDEKTVARVALLPHAPPMPPGTLVLADSNYDSAPLHRDVAGQDGGAGAWLVHPLRGQRLTRGRFRDREMRQMPASRRALVQAWERRPALLRWAMRWRNQVERVFAVLTCTGGGLAALPAWVRGLERVRRWVGTKIILYNARLEVRERLLAAAGT